MTEEQRIEVKTRIVCTLLENWDTFKPNLTEGQLLEYLDVDLAKEEETISNMLDLGSRLLSKLVNDLSNKIIEGF